MALLRTDDSAHETCSSSRRPRTLAELVEVHDMMRAVLGDPERMENPLARALFLLDADRIRAADVAHRDPNGSAGPTAQGCPVTRSG